MFFLFNGGLFAQSRKPVIAPAPGWITQVAVDYNDSSMDDDAEDGYIILSYEKQVSLQEECTYTRFCERVVSEAGVQNESQLSIGFDPTFQQLIIHNIKIIRGTTIINQLNLSKIKCIQQEGELNNFIYNGSLNAVLFLDDVRKDDIIEYSYSLKGFNPIFNHKYSTFLDLGFSVPIYQIFYKILAPKGRSLHIKNTIDTLQPSITSTSLQTAYEWKLKKVRALHPEGSLPSWYEVYPNVMVSEFESWKDVNDWVKALFPKKPFLPAALLQKIQEIKERNGSNESRILQALRFVQDDIRYMGIEIGVHTHKPASPAKVFMQRFGDCKEKTYLLCSMLGQMGIAADPVLINTDNKKAILNWLPSPFGFNHVTARVQLDGQYYFFDPTISYQRGRINNISYPDYQAGLVVTDTTTGLTVIPFKNKGAVDVKEVFDIPDKNNGQAKLCVTTTYTGSFADDARYECKSTSKYELLRNYKKFYATWFEQITADSLIINDDDSSGTLVEKEYYSIDSIWSVDKNIKKISLTSFVVQSAIRTPKDKMRTMPYALRFPASYHETIIVNLPEDWNSTPSEDDIRCGAFIFSSKFSGAGRQIELNYNFENLRDHVLPEEAQEFYANILKTGDAQDYEITYNSDTYDVKTSTTSDISFKPLYVFLLIGVLVLSVIKLAQGK